MNDTDPIPAPPTRVFIITERYDGTFTIAENTADGSVWPTTEKPNARAAIARLMQLLDIGPVAPQTIPENICIGEKLS